MALENLVFSVTLPANFALQDGSVLGSDMTFDVATALTPFYCSVKQVRLHGGIYLRKLNDLTIAGMIYEYSKQADAISYVIPHSPPVGDLTTDAAYKMYWLWMRARQTWVSSMAARELIINVFDLMGVRGQKTLGNFSVGRQEFTRDQGVPGKISELGEIVKKWELAVKSGGKVGHDGHVRPRMAAKGLYDDSDAAPGRTWLNSGPGANTYSLTGITSAGGKGKTVKFYSPVVTGRRIGRYFGPTVLVTWPRVPSY